MTHFTISEDGTRIAYSRTGRGEPLVLVDGALCHRKFGANTKLPQYLSEHFTVYSYDRRGRNESGNTLPYHPEKEYADLQAIINETGGSAYVYGGSSGAALVLEAAENGAGIKKMALFEAPYITDGSRRPIPGNYLRTLSAYIDSGQNAKAIGYFMKTGIGLPAFVVWMMRFMPAWKQMMQLAHTLTYDTEILGENISGRPFSQGKWKNAGMPAVVISGSRSAKWARSSMRHLATILPDAVHLELGGQNHLVNPRVLAGELIRFFQTEKPVIT